MELTGESIIWETIRKDGYDVEHAMNSLHRKQTGSYYTDLDLTLYMMQEMIDGISEDKRPSWAHLQPRGFVFFQQKG